MSLLVLNPGGEVGVWVAGNCWLDFLYRVLTQWSVKTAKCLSDSEFWRLAKRSLEPVGSSIRWVAIHAREGTSYLTVFSWQQGEI